ncbi:MAG: hypothetical protein SGARI_001785, partial [Bacillariaceae sp.]
MPKTRKGAPKAPPPIDTSQEEAVYPNDLAAYPPFAELVHFWDDKPTDEKPKVFFPKEKLPPGKIVDLLPQDFPKSRCGLAAVKEPGRMEHNAMQIVHWMIKYAINYRFPDDQQLAFMDWDMLGVYYRFNEAFYGLKRIREIPLSPYCAKDRVELKKKYPESGWDEMKDVEIDNKSEMFSDRVSFPPIPPPSPASSATSEDIVTAAAKALRVGDDADAPAFHIIAGNSQTKPAAAPAASNAPEPEDSKPAAVPAGAIADPDEGETEMQFGDADEGETEMQFGPRPLTNEELRSMTAEQIHAHYVPTQEQLGFMQHTAAQRKVEASQQQAEASRQQAEERKAKEDAAALAEAAAAFLPPPAAGGLEPLDNVQRELQGLPLVQFPLVATSDDGLIYAEHPLFDRHCAEYLQKVENGELPFNTPQSKDSHLR